MTKTAPLDPRQLPVGGERIRDDPDPSIGQEVLVDFKNGDPDLPIIWAVPTTRTPCLRGDCRAWRRERDI